MTIPAQKTESISLLDAFTAVRTLDPNFAKELDGAIFSLGEYGGIDCDRPTKWQIAALTFHCWDRVLERGWDCSIERAPECEAIAEVWLSLKQIQVAHNSCPAIALLAAYHAALELAKELEEEEKENV